MDCRGYQRLRIRLYASTSSNNPFRVQRPASLLAVSGNRAARHRSDLDSISATPVQRAPCISGPKTESENSRIGLVECPIPKRNQPISRSISRPSTSPPNPTKMKKRRLGTSTSPFVTFVRFCSIQNSGPAADPSNARDAHSNRRKAVSSSND
jgi:hypothetical protein